MNHEEIQRFLDTKEIPEGKHLRKDFKNRDTIYGMLVQHTDYKDLKSKNLWRIVREKDMAAWSSSKNPDLAKIFNGADFNKLSIAG
jgi:hypothetical protein